MGLLTFVIYATWRMLENANYNAEEIGLPYLSPFYSPLIPWKIEIGAYQVSPAMLILPFPAAFRATTYLNLGEWRLATAIAVSHPNV